MGARNNTTPIGDGSVGIDTEDAVSREIQRSVSENNLKYQIGQNSSIKGVFNATVAMVARWNPGDKFRILQEYGNVNSVSKSPSADELNQAVATTLIANMPKEELKRIVGTEIGKQNKLSKDVANANAKSYNLAKKYFDTKTAAQMMKEFNGAFANDNQMLKMIKQSDKGFKLDKGFKKDYPRLRKELMTLLKNFTKMELANTADRCEIEFEDNTSVKNISKLITDRVMMYVSLILGKTTGVSHNGFSVTAVEELERLLNMTSYAWVTGKVNIGDTEIANKRKAAMAAKKQLEINKKFAKEANKELKTKGSSLKTKIKNKLGMDTTGEASGKFVSKNIKYDSKNKTFNTRKTGSAMFKLNRKSYSAVSANEALEKLNKLSEDQLRSIGMSKGVIDADSIPLDNLKQQLAILASSESGAIAKQKEKALNNKNPLKREKALAEIKESKKASVFGSIAKIDKTSKQDYSDKIPVVTFNEEGVVASEGILKAVPVYIVGTAKKVGHIQSAEDVKMIKHRDADGVYNSIDESFSAIDNSSAAKGVIKKLYKKIRKKKNNDLSDDTRFGKITRGTSKELSTTLGMMNPKKMTDKQKEHYAKMTVNPENTGFGRLKMTEDEFKQMAEYIKSNLPNMEIKEFKKSGAKHTNNSVKANATKFNKKDLYEASIKAGLSEEEAKKYVALKAVKSEVTNFAYKTMTKSKISKDAIVIPVMDINRSHDHIESIGNNVQNAVNYLAGIDGSLNQIGEMWGTLQQFGLSANTAMGGAAIMMAGRMAGMPADVLNEVFKDKTKTATGGSMKGRNYTRFASGGKSIGKNSFVSNVITGDHPQNKNNTEMVSVDWANRNINVKPIPKFSTGGRATNSIQSKNSNISNLHRMSQGERNKPLSVGIGTGVVKYSKQFSDVEDDGEKSAVKVYSINNGINEKIKVGDSELSLFDAVYGIYTSVSAIAVGVSESNKLLSNISTNTSITNNKLNNIGSNKSEDTFSFTDELDTILSGN